jgi:hypothetical protein
VRSFSIVAFNIFLICYCVTCRTAHAHAAQQSFLDSFESVERVIKLLFNVENCNGPVDSEMRKLAIVQKRKLEVFVAEEFPEISIRQT